MKICIVFGSILAAATASIVHFSPAVYTAAIPITTQYHAQDGLGQYSYGYSGGPSAKAEYKAHDGVTRGSYSYVDADGELQRVEYTADSLNGFRASATNLPKAPVDNKVAPAPVQDTPEVALAKAEHFAAYREAELKAAEQPEEPQTEEVLPPAPIENGNSSAENLDAAGEAISQEVGTEIPTTIDLSGGGLSAATSSIELNGITGTGGTPAKTSELRPVTLHSVHLPARSYFHVSTPTHGYSVITPTTLFTAAVPTIRTDSLNTITRGLPISLSSTFLSQRMN